MSEKRFSIEFTVDVHHKGVTKDWDLSNDDIRELVFQALNNISPCLYDISFSEVQNKED